jgi:hypothetical protein
MKFVRSMREESSEPGRERDPRRCRALLCGLAFGLVISSRAALPAGWVSEDIGAPAKPGAGNFASGIWTVTGGGADIWNTADQFQFAHTNLSGDGAIVAQVLSQTSINPFAQSGVMLRNDNTAGSAEASVSITPTSGVTFRYRLANGASTAQSIVSGVAAPVWLRLVRSGNSFAASYSSNGVTWFPIGATQTISMTGVPLAGFCVTAHDNTTTNTATFTNLSLTVGPQMTVPSDLANKMTYQTTWPLPQLDVASSALTPRMGWNSWFVVGDSLGPTENLITNTAASLVAEGLAVAGYKIVTIDATWIASGRGSRDTNGNLIVDPTRWPDGMRFVADYVHSKGLLMGGYSDIGTNGWGNPSQIGMNGFYQQDANQFAAWTWDFIKIDDHGPGDFFSAAYAIANNESNRPIVLSLSTPQTDGLEFAPRIANSFRVNNDIAGVNGSVSWDSILWEFDTAQSDWFAQAPGHFLDPDMLMVGFNGINDLEGQTTFNLWCILGAPLMIGEDVRPGGGAIAPAITAATINTLTNAEVIAVDQDPLCAVGVQVAPNVYAKPLGSFTSGQLAILLLNRLSTAQNITVNWSSLGLANSPADVRDLWAHADLGAFTRGFTASNVPPHGSVMLKIIGVFDWNHPRTYEAESAYNSFSGTANYVPHSSAFSSGAYVTGLGFGATNAFQFNKVSAPSNGLYEVDIYYASASNRTAQVSVNGGAATNLSFASSGSDTSNISAVAAYLPLLPGENTLTFGNLTGPTPNFDRIVVSHGTPVGLEAVGGDGAVNLSWSAAATGVTFNVYRGMSSGAEIFLVGGLAGTNFTDTAVTNGMTYFYTVTEVNPALNGEGPPSFEASAKPRYATTSFAFPSAIVSNAPVAYWRLNETSGATAVDLMGSFNASYGSAVEQGIAGPRPADFLGFEVTNIAAEFFNGVNNSWLTMPPLNLNTNTVTITAWIYPIGAQAAYTGLVFCRSGGTVAGMNLNSAGTDLGYTWNNNSGSWGWSSGVQPPLNQWSFVALVAQPAGATVYLINTNGMLSATNALLHPNQAFSGAGTIGTDAYASMARVFNGMMDEVAVFNRALTPGQIQQLYDNGHQLPQVEIAVGISNASVNLNWPQGTLQQSSNLMGPWFAVTNAASSVTITPTNDSTFFRILLQQ